MPTGLSLLLMAVITYFAVQKLVRNRKYKKPAALAAAILVAWTASALPDIIDNTREVFLQYQKNTPEKRLALNKEYQSWFEEQGFTVECEISGAPFNEITFASKHFSTPAVDSFLDNPAFVEKLKGSGFKKAFFVDDITTKERIWYVRILK